MNHTIAIQSQPVRSRIVLAMGMVIGLASAAQVTNAQVQPQRPLDPIAAKMEPNRTIVYKRIGQRELRLHVFEPAKHRLGDPRSAFVIFHGGGWTGGTPRRAYPFADYFRDLGMVAISVEYRLLRKDSGETVFDCVRDGRSAIRYLRQHAESLGIDPEKIAVAGCSAGGHMAAGTALFHEVNEDSDDINVSSVPNALVLYYPVIDTSPHGYGQKKIGDSWQQLSPVHHVCADLPPTILFHGTTDTVTPYAGAAAFHAKMLDAGNQCELVSHSDGAHGYLIFALELFNAAMFRTQQFLRATEILPAKVNE